MSTADNASADAHEYEAEATAQKRREELVFLSGFLRGLSESRRFDFDGNERDALRRAGERLATLAGGRP